MKKNLQIKVLPKTSTKGFKILSSLNRTIKPAQVTKLAQSINKMGIIRPVVVTEYTYMGVKGKYIIDGQHLFHALIRNNMDVPYVEISVKDDADLVEKIALLNSSSKSWTLLDYIQAWGYINKNYITLMKHFQTYDLEISQIAGILHANSVSSHNGGGSISSVIKSGKLKIIDEKQSVVIFDYITDVLKIIPRMDRMSNKTFVSAYVDFYNSERKYNHKKFCENLKAHISELRMVTSDKSELMDFLKSM